MSQDNPINEDILADLAPPKDYLTPMDDNPRDGVTIVPDDVEGSEETAAKAEELSVAVESYKALSAKAIRFGDMKRVATRVLSLESISMTDGEEIAKTYEGVDLPPVSSYTEAPTKVNLATAQRLVAQTVQAEQSAVEAMHREYISNTYAAATELHGLLNKQIEPLIAYLGNMRQVCSADLAKAAISKNFMAFRVGYHDGVREVSNDLVDLKTCCLYNQEFENEFDPPEVTTGLPTRNQVVAFRETYHSEAIRSLFRLSKDTRPGIESIVALHREFHDWARNTETSLRGVSYIDLLTLFTSGALEDIFLKFYDGINEAQAALMKNCSDIIIADASLEYGTDTFYEKVDTLNGYYEALLMLEKYRMMLYMFVYRSLPILDGFRSRL